MRAYAQRSFFPRVMTDVTARSAATTLFGVHHTMPFGIAPMGFSRLMAPDGDVVLATAAARAGIPFILSGASLTPMEDVKALLEPRAKKLAGAIAGRALYDGRLDPAAALTLIRNARA